MTVELYQAVAGDISIPKPPNPWGRVSEIASRLDVAPYDGGATTILVTGNDGKIYDVWEVLNALLDRMDDYDRR